MRTWTRLGRVAIFGAPIYVHWSVLVAVAALALLGLSNPIYAILSVASYLAIIVLHEAGHAYIARRLGYDVNIVRVAFLHGSCEYEAPGYEWDAVLIAWGGVVAQFCIAGVVLTIAGLLGDRDIPYFGPIVVFLGYVNLLIAAVNLAPSPELDGKVAWRIVPLLYNRWRAKRATKKALRVITKRE